MTEDPDFLRSLKKAAAALREAHVPFVLGGGLAIWARGGTESDHDIDLMVQPHDAERALQTLAAAGMRPERPPEHWLLKAHDGDWTIDLIFQPAGMAVDDTLLARSDKIEVKAMTMRVMRPDDVLLTKLLAMNEHSMNFEACLVIARSLREQIDWPYVRARSKGSPFARAFFELVDGLGVSAEGEGPYAADHRRADGDPHQVVADHPAVRRLQPLQRWPQHPRGRGPERTR